MPAAKLNLAIEQGSTWRHGLALKAGLSANAPALDLTGYTALMQLRTDVGAHDILVELSVENTRITISAVDGRIDLVLTAAETAALIFDRAVYDLKVESAGGEVTRVLQGVVTLGKQVTR